MNNRNPELGDVHLSLVVVGRNDNYAQGFLERFHCYLYQLCEQLERYSKSFELVVVDWNPPPDKPRLIDQLEFLRIPDNLCLSYVQVPASVHHSLQNSERIPLFEYIGKNVGVRRSSGEFILATNPDILFTQELLDFICSDELLMDGFYRTERHDTDASFSQLNTAEKNLALASESITFSSLYRPRQGLREELVQGTDVFGHAGDFWMAHRSIWQQLCAYREFTSSGHMDTIICLEGLKAGLQQYILPSDMKIFHLNHPMSRADRPVTALNQWEQLCSRDDQQTDRRLWGLSGLELPTLTIPARGLTDQASSEVWQTPEISR